MKVVLDTNVIVAAFATRGLCADVFELCLSGHTVIISEHILSETRDKLSSKLRVPENIIQDLIAYLQNNAEVISPEPVDESVCRDKDDAKIIGTALSGKATFIITGDKDLLVLKNYEKVGIVTPREFWTLLRQEPA